MSAAVEWWWSISKLVRTRRWPQLAPPRRDAAWPHTPAAGATAGGGTSVAGHGMADGGVREGWRGERNMMALSAWKEEGLSSGDAARPSSAMAAMVARVREQQRGEGARETVSPVVHIGLARMEKQRGEARGKGEGTRRPCNKTTSAKRQTRGERRGGQDGSRFGPSMGRISEWAKNEVFSPRPALHFLLRHLGH